MSEKKGGYKKIHEHPRAMAGGLHVHPENINRKGRPRKLVSDVIKQLRDSGVENVTQFEIVNVYLSLMNMEISEIEDIVNADDVPAITRIVGKEMLSGKGFEIIERMIDRALGKANENIKVEGTGGFNVIFENYGIDKGAKNKKEKKTKKE